MTFSTDGYANAFADADWHRTVAADFLKLLGEQGFDSIARRLTDWLSDSADIGGDDVTMALLVGEPGPPIDPTFHLPERPGTTSIGDEITIQPSGAADRPDPGPERVPRVWVVIVLLALVVLGLAIGLGIGLSR